MKSKIGIFRALDVRFAHAEFAASFQEFTPVFTANISPDIKKYLEKQKVIYHDLQLVPAYFADPLFPLLKKTDFTPWLVFNPEVVNAISSQLQFFEIYEPYFFYSSQIADIAKKKGKPLITELWTSFPEHPSRYLPPYSFLVKNVLEKTDLFLLRSKRAAQ